MSEKSKKRFDYGSYPSTKWVGTFGCECGYCLTKDNYPVTRSEIAPVQTDIQQFASDMWDIIDRCGNLLLDKQEDYGPTNISRAPGGALNGLRVRIFDKISRINNLIETGATPNNESLRDSFVDLANYATIALMVIDGVWPGVEKN